MLNLWAMLPVMLHQKSRCNILPKARRVKLFLLLQNCLFDKPIGAGTLETKISHMALTVEGEV